MSRHSALLVVGGALLIAAGVLLVRRQRQVEVGRAESLQGRFLEGDPLHLVYDPKRRIGPQPDPMPGIPRAKVWHGEELRNALVLPIASRFSVRTEAPANSVLQIGAALLRDSVDVRSPGVTFTVNAVLARGGRRTLFSRHIDPAYNEDDRSWVDERVALSRESQAVMLEFETTPDEASAPGLQARAAWSYPRVLTARRPQRPNVILVSIDTLRADRLGCYGYGRHPTTPSLDRLASQGVRFAHTYAQAPWTTPSHASMLTGLYVSRHGVVMDSTWIGESVVPPNPIRVLQHSTRTLASRLREAGYDTAAFTGGATVGARLGFAQGFDTVREDFGHLDGSDSQILTGWLARHERQPFFLFLHTFEVHAPYVHPRFATVPEGQLAPFGELITNHGDATYFFKGLQRVGVANVDVTSALYDGGIRYVDDFMSQLMQSLEVLGKQDDTIVIVTSDHGEEFADHHPDRFYNAHAYPMYDELLRVPLIMRFSPRIPAGSVVKQPVRSIDIVPTILDLVGLPPVPDLDGRSLAPMWESGGTRNRPLSILSEASDGPFEIKSLRHGRFKYIAPTNGPAWTANTPREGGDELYDLHQDPRERRNLVASRTEVAADLKQKLWALVERARRSQPPATSPAMDPRLDPELGERLRALGYVN